GGVADAGSNSGSIEKGPGMPGKKPRLNSLALRKKLLVAESEINRARLLEDGEIVLAGARAASQKVRSVSAWIPTAGLLATTVGAFLRNRKSASRRKTSWIQTAFKGVKILGLLWMTFRGRRKHPS